ncbi:hypothetical protein [Leucothrix mucor]|uniref:hypothetical protein n=1 Tax=Leucothrix mucor TaxID=45248 RepID=UPI0003B66259|nr:hypothetical protein [Leucothrix mucor]
MSKCKNSVSYYIHRIIPRSKGDQPNIYVDQQNYLSRLANLKSKYIGVEHRKEQWDFYTSSHLKEINAKTFYSLKPSSLSELPEGSVVTRSFKYRDIRLENEFQAIIYSISSALSALTYVITSFVKGSQSLHSHTKLIKILLKTSDNSILSRLIIESGESWYDELKVRRDTGTYYVSLLLKSTLEHTILDGEEFFETKSILSLMKYPVKKNFLLLDDIPLLDGSEMKSKSSVINGKVELEEQVLDINKQVVYQSNSQKIDPIDPIDPIELIDGISYINNICFELESYVIKVLEELNKKII